MFAHTGMIHMALYRPIELKLVSLTLRIFGFMRRFVITQSV